MKSIDTTAAGNGKAPSYEALLIIAQSVCGALSRAGVTDCDDPGEAIDVMREKYEERLANLSVSKPDSADPGGDVEQMIKVLREIDGMRQAIGASEEIGQQYREACCTFVHDNSEALIAALPAPRQAGETGTLGFDFYQHLHRQRDWSKRTFGPGARTAGVIDHIRKELREIEANPNDLCEWIDVAILALDGAWRSGASPLQIIETLVGKQTKNEGRTWPDWRTADPNKAIEHDRSQ